MLMFSLKILHNIIQMSLILELCKQASGIPNTPNKEYHLSQIFYYQCKAYIFVNLAKHLQNQIVAFKHHKIIYSSRRIFSFTQTQIETLNGILIQMGQISKQEAQNYKFIGFCIESYPFIAQKQLVLAPLYYGNSVFEVYGEYIKQRIVSNCFILNNQVFYMINNEQNEQNIPLSQIKQQICGKTCGIKILFGTINFCLSFQYIFEGIKPSLRIKKEIMENLEKVVYVRYESSHCSGLLIERDKVITVRHLFNSIPQQNAVVYVRVYPYLKERKARIQPFPKISIDVLIFKLISEGQEHYCINHKSSKQQQSLLIHQQSKKLHQGQKIYCMGFGKYSYHNFMFSRFDLVLPTITEGVISKIIDFQDEQVYFKTDGYLYNGFSGAPIWSNQNWIGLSIFILKNINGSIKYPRHNFSYSSKFIEKYICNPTPPEITPKMESNITFFQGIQTRHRLIPKL